MKSAAAAFERRDALMVSASFLRTAFGGASAAYSLWLGQPCTSVVVVHLMLPSDAAASVRLSSDRLCFTPDNFSAPQLVRVDALENHTQWNVISHRLFSLDRNYDRAVAPNVVVQIEATPIECPLLTFGAPMTKRKAAAMGSQPSTRLDIKAALPEEVNHDTTDAATQDVSWCVSHMACGSHFSVVAVAQPKGNTLLSWGLNANGELGNGTMISSPLPQPVVTFSMQFQREPLTVSHVSCGKHHAAVITGQARLFTWGSNKYGQLGLGDFAPRTQPEEVHFALATLSSHRRALRVMHTVQRGGNNVTHVACGAAHTLFVTHQQQILGMGYNQAGQLGLGHRLQQRKGWRSCTPIAVESLRDQSILDLAAGQNHSACVLSNGDVYTWGCGDDGRLGHSTLGEGASTPTLITSLRDASIRARAVRCGARHMAVLSDNDLLYIWGANEFGQLGCRDKKPRSRPFLLATPSLFADGVADVALGEFHTTCMTLTGKAYTWGLNLKTDGALVGSYDSPQLVELPDKEQVRKVACGWANSNIITHVTPDEASASGQGTNFDRKMERERLLQRKDEVARWRSFVYSAVSPTKAQSPPVPTKEVRVEAKQGEPDVVHVSSPRDPPCRLNSPPAITSPLEKLVTAYAKLPMQRAQTRVARLVRTCRSSERRQHGRSLKISSQQLKGIFYRNQLRPPDLPSVTDLPASWTSPRGDFSSMALSASAWRDYTIPSSVFRPMPPPQNWPRGGSSRPRTAATMASATDKLDNSTCSAPCTTKFAAQTPSHKPIASRSPRVTVVEALMHRPSYSIAQGALASARLRQSLEPL